MGLLSFTKEWSFSGTQASFWKRIFRFQAPGPPPEALMRDGLCFLDLHLRVRVLAGLAFRNWGLGKEERVLHGIEL